MTQTIRASLFALCIILSASLPTYAADDFFVAPPNQSIQATPTLNDGAISSNATIRVEPKFGKLERFENGAFFNDAGEFRYTPELGFQGMDHFVYSIETNNSLKHFQVRLAIGAVQILSANDPTLALTALADGNRVPLILETRSDDVRSLWQVTDAQNQIQFQNIGAASRARVIETWQPNAAGEDVTLYQRNNLPWQHFSVRKTRFGNDQLRSQYTDFSITRIDGTPTAQAPDGTSKDNWLLTGATQTPPPSSVDDRVSTDVGQVVQGNVLSNDRSNSADIAAFLATPPTNGELVGLEADIYGGLAPFGTFNYQPDPDFEGLDSFTYFTRGSSNGAASHLTTVTIRVGRANQPIALNDLFITPSDTSIAGRVTLNDFNAGGSPSGAAVLVAPPNYGQLTGLYQQIYGGLAPFGDFEYQPPAGFNGLDSFAYRIISGDQQSAVTTVFIVVGDVQMAPFFNWRLNLGTRSVQNRSAFSVADENELVSKSFNFNRSTIPEQYVVGYADKAMETWQPNATGKDATLYTANNRAWQQFGVHTNSDGSFSLQSIYTTQFLAVEDSQPNAFIKAQPQNDNDNQKWLIAGNNQAFAPTARDDSFSVIQDTQLRGRVLTNDTANGFDMLALPVTQPNNGVLTGVEGSIYGGVAPWGAFTYQPNAGFVGTDSFVYQVFSSFGGAPSRYVSVTINVLPDE